MTLSNDPVVITGIGMTTPLGGNTGDTWTALLAGKSGTTILDDRFGERCIGQIAAPIAVEPSEVLEDKIVRTTDRVQQFALIAAAEAWADSGIDRESLDSTRLAVCIGSGIGGANTILDSNDLLWEHGPRKVSPRAIPSMLTNGPAASVSMLLEARGGAHAPVSACSSGAEAIALGMDILAKGDVDVVVAGGSEASIIPLAFAGFGSMRALSTNVADAGRASRPYDKNRDGFVLGEGSALLVLERASSAVARGATIYGIVAGAGISSDAFHMVAPEPMGAGASLAIQRALRHADMATTEVRHLNAHATSTPVGDIAESRAIRSALGSHTDQVAISATKSQTAHLISGTGAAEAAFTALALRSHLAPAVQHIQDLDPEIDLDVVHTSHRELPADAAALSTSFGFGGHNVALALRPWTSKV